MPELLEAEISRRALVRSVGRTIRGVRADPPSYLRHGPLAGAAVAATLEGLTVSGVRRHGKVVLVDLIDGAGDGDDRRAPGGDVECGGHVLAIRFGMTGRVVVDEEVPIGDLEYGPGRPDPAWDRCVVRFTDGGTWRFNDPRRLGRLELDPDLTGLGPDAATIDRESLAGAMGTTGPLKAALMNQSRVAGLGNLLTDDVLWRAGLAPTRMAKGLTDDEIDRLVAAIHETIRELGERGGSHTGDLRDERHPSGRCPLDGSPLRRDRIGGRSTWWCPVHQH